MSTSADAGGVFGIALWDRSDVADIYNDLKDFLVVASVNDPAFDSNSPESVRGFRKFEKRIIQRLEARRIIVPKGARLISTGLDDDRPGDSVTPGDEFVIGFGLFTLPWKYPEMDVSFKLAAKWHTWAWAG